MIEADIFKALADPTRRKVFEKLAGGSLNASALRDGLEISQPAMSQHLAVLRELDIVATRREAQAIHYRVIEGPALGVLQALHAAYCGGTSR